MAEVSDGELDRVRVRYDMDFVSYIIGLMKGIRNGTGKVVFEDSEDYTFTDAQGDGNIVIEKEGE